MAALRVGDPLDAGTHVGPLVDQNGHDKVSAHVQDALAKGARALVGGAPRGGLFFDPTVLVDVAPGMRILQEETFGPIAPLVRFTSDAEAVAQANGTPFGLAAYLWTRDLTRAFRVSEALDFGIVGVNDGAPVDAPGAVWRGQGLGTRP